MGEKDEIPLTVRMKFPFYPVGDNIATEVQQEQTLWASMKPNQAAGLHPKTDCFHLAAVLKIEQTETE